MFTNLANYGAPPCMRIWTQATYSRAHRGWNPVRWDICDLASPWRSPSGPFCWAPTPSNCRGCFLVGRFRMLGCSNLATIVFFCSFFTWNILEPQRTNRKYRPNMTKPWVRKTMFCSNLVILRVKLFVGMVNPDMSIHLPLSIQDIPTTFAGLVSLVQFSQRLTSLGWNAGLTIH